MRSEKYLIFIFLCAFFLISSCQEDKGKGDYSGVSELISDRNRARYEKAQNKTKRSDRPERTTQAKKPAALKPSTKASKDTMESIILYEEKVEIVGSDSQRVLAKGVAYVNKKGQIVRIKIIKE